MRQRPDKVDSNQQDIIDALHAYAPTTHLGDVKVLVSRTPCGDGHPDLLVGIRVGWMRPFFVTMEVKHPTRKLNAMQKKWHTRFDGWPCFVVDSAERAVKIVADEVRVLTMEEKGTA